MTGAAVVDNPKRCDVTPGTASVGHSTEQRPTPWSTATVEHFAPRCAPRCSKPAKTVRFHRGALRATVRATDHPTNPKKGALSPFWVGGPGFTVEQSVSLRDRATVIRASNPRKQCGFTVARHHPQKQLPRAN